MTQRPARDTEAAPGAFHACRAQDDIDLSCINTIRTLSMDAVQKANSGHPGTPMALAPVAYTLWQEFLRFDPSSTRSGRTATASSSPSATPRCSSTRSST